MFKKMQINMTCKLNVAKFKEWMIKSINTKYSTFRLYLCTFDNIIIYIVTVAPSCYHG